MKIFNFISSTFGIKVDITPNTFPQMGTETVAPGHHYCLVHSGYGEFVTPNGKPVDLVAIDSSGSIRHIVRDGSEDIDISAVTDNWGISRR